MSTALVRHGRRLALEHAEGEGARQGLVAGLEPSAPLGPSGILPRWVSGRLGR
jgi:hypothetical protein